MNKSGFKRASVFYLCLLIIIGATLFFHVCPKALRWPIRISLILSVGTILVMAVRFCLTIRPSLKEGIFSVVAGLLCYSLVYFICHLFILLMGQRDSRITVPVITHLAEEHKQGIRAMLEGKSYEMYDKDIGWTPRPDYHEPGVTISSQGVRSLRNYTTSPVDPEKRVLCLGDSFTYGHGVNDDQTYPYFCESMNPGSEWINLGISGACPTQFLIQYRKHGRGFGGKNVVIGFMTDDAKRTVNCFRAFLTAYNPFTKPFAMIKRRAFSIQPNPYQDINDYNKLLVNEIVEIDRLKQIDYLTWSNQHASSNPILNTLSYLNESLSVGSNVDDMLKLTTANNKKSGASASDPYAKRKVTDSYGRMNWNTSEKAWSKVDASVDPYGRAIWNPNSLGFVALTKVFDLLYSEILNDGRKPLIVLIPGPLDVEYDREKLPRIYQTLLNDFEKKNYHYIDFLDTLKNENVDDLSKDALFVGNHYTAKVNKQLAVFVSRAVKIPNH